MLSINRQNIGIHLQQKNSISNVLLNIIIYVNTSINTFNKVAALEITDREIYIDRISE